MQTLTLEQFRTITEAGGVLNVVLKAKGGTFFITVKTRSGENAILSKARSKEPRGFGDPKKAMVLLHELGINAGHFDASQWDPEQRDMSKSRPSRAEAMKKAHAAAAYNEWLAKEVEAAINDPRPNISHAEAMKILDAEILSLEKKHKAKKRKA